MDPVTQSARTNIASMPTPDNRPALQRAPLVPVAVAFVSGIVTARYVQMPAGFWTACAFAMIVVASTTAFRQHLHAITCGAVAVTILCIGGALCHSAFCIAEKDHIVSYTSDQPILATLRGRVVTSPVRYRDTTSIGYRRPDRTGLVMKVAKIRTNDGWSPATGLLRVMIQESADHLAAGQDVELIGKIGRFAAPRNPGQFDRAGAARLKGTLVWMTVPGRDGATLLRKSQQTWYERVYWNLRAATRQHLASFGDESEARLLQALVIGERDPGIAELNRAMARAGVAHLLSISGLHMGIFLGFIYMACRLCMLTPRSSALFVLTALLVYVLLAEPRVPLLRSATMASALCAATIWRRKYGTLNALAAAAIVLLACDPMQAFSPGFQLSFAIVTCVVLAHSKARRIIFGRWILHRGLVVLRTDQTLKRWVYYTFGNWAMDIVSVALVAYLAALPLVAYHFGLFTPYAAPLSILLLPLVVAVLVPGYISIALFWPLPGLSYTVGRASVAAAGLMTKAISAFDILPGLCIELRPFDPGWVVMCYATLTLIVLANKLPFARITVIGATGLLATWTVLGQLPAPPPSNAELHLFAVGSAQCGLVRTPSGKTYILDAGAAAGYDAAKQVIGPALTNLRLPKPSEAFISHANTDHFNAMPNLVLDGHLRRVYLNNYFGQYIGPTSLGESAPKQLMKLLHDKNVEIVRLRRGDSVRLDSRTVVKVLWPPREHRNDLNVNDTSLVLRITCDNASVMLTGDLGQIPQQALAQSAEDISANVLVLPHHGGWETSLPAFFGKVDPEVVLVSTRQDPMVATAALDQDRSDFYRTIALSCHHYSTSRDGYIRLSFGRGGISVRTMRQMQGW